VDEVLAVGDAQFQRKCLDKMSEVGAAGRTVLFVSHNMPAVTRLCQRGMLLSHGKLVADGAAADVVAQYLSLGRSEGTVRQWPPEAAPGSYGLKLLRVAIHKADGSPAPAVVSVTDPLQVRVTCRAASPLRFRLAISLFTQGTCAFSAVEPVEWERLAGDCTSAAVIPANLLTEGEYTVGVSAFASRGSKMRYAAAQDVLTFQTVDPMTADSARGDYAERMLGVVRPKLEWVRLTGQDAVA
jgi:lipopolysaccharide transport system ATP-binding protein